MQNEIKKLRPNFPSWRNNFMQSDKGGHSKLAEKPTRAQKVYPTLKLRTKLAFIGLSLQILMDLGSLIHVKQTVEV